MACRVAECAASLGALPALLERIDPEDRERYQAARAARSRSQAGCYALQYRLRGADGATRDGQGGRRSIWSIRRAGSVAWSAPCRT